MRRNGQPAAAYAWHVAPGGVLVVVDLDRDGWRSVTHDAAGVVHDLAELRPDLLTRVPLIAYRDSMGGGTRCASAAKVSLPALRRLAPQRRRKRSPGCWPGMVRRAGEGSHAATRVGDLVGYARVSTRDQTVALQLDALNAAGCVRVFEETASGAQRDRPQLAAALDYMRAGDTLVVWKLDRLARSTKQLIETVEGLARRGIGFRCLTQDIDTTTAGGRLVFTIFSASRRRPQGCTHSATIPASPHIPLATPGHP